MTKKDIGAGDLVLLRDGRMCIVRRENNRLALYGRPSDNYHAITLINMLDDYNDDLIIWMDADNYHSHDIISVSIRGGNLCLGNYLIDILLSKVIPSKIIWDWERNGVKEVTMAEVEEKFGCKVKIVKEVD